MSDTLRERCIEAGRDAMGRSSSWRWWAPRHLEKLFDLWEPMIRADEAKGVQEAQQIRAREIGRLRYQLTHAESDLREQVAAGVRVWCDHTLAAEPCDWCQYVARRIEQGGTK